MSRMARARLQLLLFGIIGALATVVVSGAPATAEHMSAEILERIPPDARSHLSPEMVEQINRVGHLGDSAAPGAPATDSGAFAAAQNAGNERIHTFDVQLVIE